MDKRPHKILMQGVKELFSLTLRGAEKLKDKYIWTKKEIEEANGYLIYFRDTMKNEDKPLFHTIFGDSGDFFELAPLARGYSAHVLSFKSVVGKEIKRWVLKVGFRYALIELNGDPSRTDYAKEYQAYIDTLRHAVKQYPHLGHLLPEPQVITFAHVALSSDEKNGTTLAIQPFMHVVRPRDLKKTITLDEKKQLLTELREFQDMSAYLVKHHEVGPELVGEGNLEIVKFVDTYHLVLLDMGWVDFKKILPVTQTVNHFTTMYVINKLENWLKNRWSLF